MGEKPGQIIILNGAPRAGKSSIAAAIQETFEGPWMNLGTDTFILAVTPPRFRPGVGLRPGGGRQVRGQPGRGAASPARAGWSLLRSSQTTSSVRDRTPSFR